jgi:hypothetical protein
MTSGSVLRVFCVDGPCRGVQYLNEDTGRVLFSDAIDAEYCIYRVDLAETSVTLAGSWPAAYFDSFDAPWPGHVDRAR